MSASSLSNFTCGQCGASFWSQAEGCPGCLFQLATDVGFMERTSAQAFTVPEQDRLAALMPDFEILELIGRGGMGAVFKVRQIRLNRTAALKVLPPERAADPAFIERFFREAQALAQLSHPNIVDVFDMGQRGSYLYILMEYVDGQPVRTAIREKRLTASDALRIAADLCAALACAHARGLVHRDIKPENVLLKPDGRVKLLDFGLVKLTEDSRIDRFSLTEAALRMGTPQYMAPEQLNPAASIDHRTDLYALGVLLYEMLTGLPPVLNYTPASRRTAVDSRIDRVVQRALQESPADRYQSADEFRREIEHIRRTPNRRGITASVVTTLFGLALVAVFWLRSPPADTAPPPGTPIDGIPIAVAPFDAVEARAHQERWAQHLRVPVQWTNSVGMTFALIPPGEYTRGVPDDEIASWIPPPTTQPGEPAVLALIHSQYPAHRVRLTKPFYLAITETTQAQFDRLIDFRFGFFRVGGAGESRLAEPDTRDLPIETLAWVNADVFCRKLSELEGTPSDEPGYRLPTEGEWEFALRAGATTPYWFGNDADRDGLYEISSVHAPIRTRRVASLRPNAFGLYDMAGNVSEYCADWWSPDEFKKYADRCAVDPTGPQDGALGGFQRVVRGGYFGDLSRQHSNARSRHDPSVWSNTIGFRTAIDARTVARLIAAGNATRPAARN